MRIFAAKGTKPALQPLSQNAFPSELLGRIPFPSATEQDAFRQAEGQEPVVSVRLNRGKPGATWTGAQPVPWCPEGRILADRPSFTADPLWHAGAYYVQEASSMFLDFALRELLDLEKPLRVLDLCAAPGGKSTLLASVLNEESLLLANETIASRAGILSENLCRWGQLNTWVSQSDPSAFGKLGPFFDVLCVDAPCSGSGLFRKMPDYRQEWNPNLVHHCALRQQRILSDSLPALKPGGILVYMTCSFSPEENEEIVDDLLSRFPLESLALHPDPAWGVVETLSSEHGGAGYRFFPHRVQGEGFFLACFRRKDEPFNERTLNPVKQDARMLDLIRPFANTTGLAALPHDGQLLLLRESHLPWLTFLSKGTRLIRRGILAGKVIKGGLLPDHELAMYTGNTYGRRREVDLADAVRYLRKEDFDFGEAEPGWYLLTYHGVALGWIKHLGKRFNNYYPSGWRIQSKNILPA